MRRAGGPFGRSTISFKMIYLYHGPRHQMGHLIAHEIGARKRCDCAGVTPAEVVWKFEGLR